MGKTDMDYYLVKFAFAPTDLPHYFLLDEQKYDDWCMADSGTEGYAVFEVVWKGPIESFIFSKHFNADILIDGKSILD